MFVLAAPGDSGQDFITEEDGEQGKELVIRFEYRPATLTDWPEDERDEKKRPPVQKDLITLAAKRVLAVADAGLMPWIAELGKQHVMASGERADYSRLEAHLRRYTARNTFDYFIHKDLGTFLRRELDFYIKNEVMHLDDVENESAPRVEQYLSKDQGHPQDRGQDHRLPCPDRGLPEEAVAEEEVRGRDALLHHSRLHPRGVLSGDRRE